MKCSFFISALLAAFLCASSYFVPVARSTTDPDASPSRRTPAQSPEAVTIAIPGPLRSFLRMAGISQKIAPEEVLPLLARNIYLHGYEGLHRGHQTEFLLLLIRYVRQARELTALAGPQGVLHVSNCDEAKPLLKVLGYRPRPDCGQSNASLLTDDPERAFLTIDSGFPLLELEASLRESKPFDYSFVDSRVPALLAENDWRQKGITKESDLIDALLQDPALAHFYWALSRMDRE